MKFLLIIYLTIPDLGQQYVRTAEFNSLAECQIQLHADMIFYGHYYTPKTSQVAVAVSEDELEFHWNNMVTLFGERLPNPDREPRRFAYYCKIYNHLKKLHGG